jgi:hypothetical protein
VASAFWFHTARGVCHELSKLLRLEGVGIHLSAKRL